MMTMACRKRVKMWRAFSGWYQTQEAQEFPTLSEFATHTIKVLGETGCPIVLS
jgi:hypothetical protein